MNLCLFVLGLPHLHYRIYAASFDLKWEIRLQPLDKELIEPQRLLS